MLVLRGKEMILSISNGLHIGSNQPSGLGRNQGWGLWADKKAFKILTNTPRLVLALPITHWHLCPKYKITSVEDNTHIVLKPLYHFLVITTCHLVLIKFHLISVSPPIAISNPRHFVLSNTLTVWFCIALLPNYTSLV